ncbi:hypothetical protein [Pseudomonas sp.]|uniref:hypothetical protein n=1 Tax=Pseudomonas sp. TaxID=306 RepID=UPI0028AE901C|nr:hypothetical protein [Pseudomonas sp.]
MHKTVMLMVAGILVVLSGCDNNEEAAIEHTNKAQQQTQAANQANTTQARDKHLDQAREEKNRASEAHHDAQVDQANEVQKEATKDHSKMDPNAQ